MFLIPKWSNIPWSKSQRRRPVGSEMVDPGVLESIYREYRFMGEVVRRRGAAERRRWPSDPSDPSDALLMGKTKDLSWFDVNDWMILDDIGWFFDKSGMVKNSWLSLGLVSLSLSFMGQRQRCPLPVGEIKTEKKHDQWLVNLHGSWM